MNVVSSSSGKAIGTGLTFAQDYLAFTPNVKNPFARFALKCICTKLIFDTGSVC